MVIRKVIRNVIRIVVQTGYKMYARSGKPLSTSVLTRRQQVEGTVGLPPGAPGGAPSSGAIAGSRAGPYVESPFGPHTVPDGSPDGVQNQPRLHGVSSGMMRWRLVIYGNRGGCRR